MTTTSELYQSAKRHHRVAVGGTFMTQAEFAAQPKKEQESYVEWLRIASNDVRNEMIAEKHTTKSTRRRNTKRLVTETEESKSFNDMFDS